MYALQHRGHCFHLLCFLAFWTEVDELRHFLFHIAPYVRPGDIGDRDVASRVSNVCLVEYLVLSLNVKYDLTGYTVLHVTQTSLIIKLVQGQLFIDGTSLIVRQSWCVTSSR